MIPLDAVAPDARELIRAFRETAAAPLHDLEPAAARAAYLAACRANAPTPDAGIDARSVTISAVPCRVYDPAPGCAASTDGTILFFHGGGWVVGNLDTHDEVCRSFAAATGIRVVAVNYRLAPEHPFPAAHDDATTVAAAILGDGAGLADPSRVIVMGDSAGGSLAAWVAAESTRDRFAHRPLGQVLVYPVTDLTGTRPSYRRITEGFPLTAATMRWFAATYAPDSSTRDDPRLSPLLHPLAAPQPPAFVCTTGLDPLADEGIAYAGALASSGTPVEHHHFPRHTHGLLTAAGRVRSGLRLRDQVGAFVRELLRETPQL